MIQTPFPPKEEIQIEAARAPWQLPLSITTQSSFKLMQLSEQLQSACLREGTLHPVEQTHGIAIKRLSWWTTHWSRL